jgi:hypothetical protein
MNTPDEQLPISGYDGLKEKEITDQLSELTQAELATVETYERSHRDRKAVLAKLNYMRGGEPLPGYDALTTEEIATALAGADAATVKAVRDYERKFGRRHQVMAEAARLLPSATASAAEDRAKKERGARVREGFAHLDKTAPDRSE